MPQLVEEADALQLWNLLPDAPEDEKPQIAAIIRRYEEQEQSAGRKPYAGYHQAQVNRAQNVRRIFTDKLHGMDQGQFDAFKSKLSGLRDPDSVKFELFNSEFLAPQYGHRPQDIDGRLPHLMQDYAQKRWGIDAPLSGGQFFKMVQSDYALADKQNAASLSAAISDRSTPSAWEEFKAANKSDATWNPARERDRAKQFYLTSHDLRVKSQAVRPVADQVEATLSASDSAERIRQIVPLFSSLSDFEAGLVLATLEHRAAGAKDKGIAQQTAETGYRTVRDIWREALQFADETALDLARGRAERDNDIPESIIEKGPEAIADHLLRLKFRAQENIFGDLGRNEEGPRRSLSDTERQGVYAVLDKRVSENKEILRLQGIHDQIMDPVKADNWFTREYYYPAVSSGAAMLNALLPGGVGLISSFAHYSKREKDRMISLGVSPNVAHKQALGVGAVQAALDKLGGDILIGKFPITRSLMLTPAPSIGGQAARLGVNWAFNATAETGIEILQDKIVPALIQDISGQGGDVAWLGSAGVWQKAWEAVPEAAAPMLLLGLIGATSSGVSDFAQARTLLQNEHLLAAYIDNQAQVAEIRTLASNGNYSGAAAKFREYAAPALKQGVTLSDAGKKALETFSAETSRQQAAEERLTLLGAPVLERIADGWRAKYEDGSSMEFDTHEEANAARWQWVEDKGFDVHQQTRDIFAQMERNAEVGREFAIEFSPEEMTGRRAVETGLAPEAQLEERREVANTLTGKSQASTKKSEAIAEDKDFENAVVLSNAMASSPDDSLASARILGMSKTEFKDGVMRTTMRLFHGATPLTAIEEKLEGDVDVMIRDGRRGWLLSALRDVEAKLGDRLFRTADDSKIKDSDLKEAWSHLGQSYFVGRSRKGNDAGLDSWKNDTGSRNFFARIMRSKAGAAMQAYTTFFRAVWRRAAKLNKLRREGGLDVDLEHELALSLGLEQRQHDAAVFKEASHIVDEAHLKELENLEDGGAAFSMLPGDLDSTPESNEASIREGEDPQTPAAARALKQAASRFAGAGRAVYFGPEQSGRIPDAREAQLSKLANEPEAPPPSSPPVFQGGEHRVFVPEEAETITKHTLKGEFGRVMDERDLLDPRQMRNVRQLTLRGALPSEYLTRLAIMSEIFGLDTDYLGRVGVDESMATSQPFVPQDEGTVISEEAVQGFMEGHGFARVDEKHIAIPEIKKATWYRQRDGLLVTDALPRNFRQTPDGILVPVDLVIVPIPPGASRILAEPSAPWNQEREISLSFVTGSLDARLAAAFDPFQRTPAIREKLTLEAQRRIARFTREWEMSSQRDRTVKDINEERRLREDQLFMEKLGKAGAVPEMADIKNHPILHEVWGRMLPLSQAKKRGITNEYDDAPPLPRDFYKGSRAPDQLAQELHDGGLLPDAYPSTLWKAVEHAYAAVSKNAAAVKKAAQEARAEAKEWAAAEKQRANAPATDRARLLAALRTLDAILSVVPPEVRSKVGGYVQLAKLSTDEARVKEIEHRIGKLNKLLEAWLQKEITGRLDKLLEKAEPKGEAGEKLKGKIGADGHRWYSLVAEAVALDEDATAKEMAAEESVIADPNAEPAKQDAALERWTVLHQFGGWEAKTAAEMHTAVEAAERVYSEGRAAWKKVLEERKAIRDELRATAGDEAGGQPGWDDRQKAAGGEMRSGQWQKVKDWFNRHYSFQQVLQTIFGSGATMRHFENRARAATRQKTDAVIRRIAEFRDGMRSILGTDSWRDTQRALFELQQRVTDAPVTFYAPATVRRREAPADIVRLIVDGNAKWEDYDFAKEFTQDDKEQMERLLEENDTAPARKKKGMLAFETVATGPALDKGELSQFEAVHFSMLAKQEIYREAMERHGITAETLDDIEAWLTPQAKAIRAWLFEQYEKGYAPMNELYSRMFGVALPKVENYAPGYFEHEGKQSEMDPFGSGMEATGMAAGFLKKRKNHRARPVQLDALQAYWQHVFQTEHWLAWAETIQEMRSVFGNVDLRATMEARRGNALAGDLLWWVETLEKGGVRDSQANAFLAKIMQANVRLALGYKVSVLLKQLPAIMGSLSDMPAGAWVRSARRVLTGKAPISPTAMFNMPTIQRRIDSGYSPEMRAAMRGPTARPSTVEDVLEWGMERIAWTDAAFTSFSAAVAYDYHYSEALKLGMPEAEAARVAMEQAENTVGRTSQPGEVMDRSRLELEAKGLGKLLFMFQSANRQGWSLVQLAASDVMRGKGDAKTLGRVVFNQFVVMPVMMQTMAGLVRYLFTDDEAEEAWAVEDYAMAMALGPMSGIVFIGAAIQAIGQNLSGKTFGNRADNPFVEAAATSARALQDAAEGGFDQKDAANLATSTSLLLSGFVNVPTESAGVAWNVLKQVLGLADSAESIAEGEK
jgi:hypothetical protein